MVAYTPFDEKHFSLFVQHCSHLESKFQNFTPIHYSKAKIHSDARQRNVIIYSTSIAVDKGALLIIDERLITKCKQSIPKDRNLTFL